MPISLAYTKTENVLKLIYVFMESCLIQLAMPVTTISESFFVLAPASGSPRGHHPSVFLGLLGFQIDLILVKEQQNHESSGTGCASVSRVVASNSSGPGIKSYQLYILSILKAVI